jgi:hypothetical protein
VVAACVDPKDAHRVWPHISHLIESAMRRGRLSDFAAVANGSFTVTHANNAQTDRTFAYVCLG